MFSFKGNTSVAVQSTALDSLPSVMENISIVNKVYGDVVVNVYLMNGSNRYAIAPFNKVLHQGEMYESERPVLVLPTEQIEIHPSGSVDYVVLFSNEQSPIVNRL